MFRRVDLVKVSTFILALLTIATCVTATSSPTLVPTLGPSTFKPTVRPSSKAPTAAPVHIYGSNSPVDMSLDKQQGLVAVLTVLLFILMATEVLAPEILFLIALMIITGCEIITITDCLSGFSNESLITIGTLVLVVGAVEKSHAVDI